MEKKQIIPFLILVLVTVLSACFIFDAGTYEPFVDTLQKKQVQVVPPPVVDVVAPEPVATSSTPTEPVKTIATSTKQTTEPEPQVSDFFSCVDVTGTILESYPRQCIFGGTTFVEKIKDLVEVPGDTIELVVEVGPELVDCVGVSEQSCMMVDGDLFYDVITGFTHEAGFRQTLKIARTLAWGTTDPEKIPADAGLYAYELLEVLSKEAVTIVNNCVVAGCSSQLCISKDEQEAGGGISTCEFREEYACYRFSECREQADGQCGWTMTPEVTQCLENPPTLQSAWIKKHSKIIFFTMC